VLTYAGANRDSDKLEGLPTKKTKKKTKPPQQKKHNDPTQQAHPDFGESSSRGLRVKGRERMGEKNTERRETVPGGSLRRFLFFIRDLSLVR